MKFVLFSGILIFLTWNVFAQKPIKCVVEIWKAIYIFEDEVLKGCKIFDSIDEDESVTIIVEPSNTNIGDIEAVQFKSDLVYSIPPEIFTKFVNLKRFEAYSSYLNEIQPGTFDNAKNLTKLDLAGNYLYNLPIDVFKGRKVFLILN